MDTDPQTEGNAPEAPQGQPQASEQPGYFEERFDPASLPPELRPGYQQMRNAFHAKTQSLAEERQGLSSPQTIAQAYAGWSPEERQEFFEQAGLEYEDPDEDYEDEDDYDDDYEDQPLADPRVDALLAEREDEQEQALQLAFNEAQLDTIEDGLDDLEEKLGRGLSDEEIQVIGDQSWYHLDEDGMPSVEEAYARYSQASASTREAAASPKRRLRGPGAGTPGGEKVDWSDPDARRQALAAEIEAAEAEG